MVAWTVASGAATEHEPTDTAIRVSFGQAGQRLTRRWRPVPPEVAGPMEG